MKNLITFEGELDIDQVMAGDKVLKASFDRLLCEPLTEGEQILARIEFLIDYLKANRESEGIVNDILKCISGDIRQLAKHDPLIENCAGENNRDEDMLRMDEMGK
ncbi:MAG: hypothetical protein AAF217_02955 [Pseudomonadota bacterium]